MSLLVAGTKCADCGVCDAAVFADAREIFARLSAAQKAIALAAVLTHGLERE